MTAIRHSGSRPDNRLLLGRRPFLGLLGSLALPAAGLPVPAMAGTAGGLEDAAVGYTLFEPDSGRALEAQAADTPFIPASVAKLPTAAAALALLGPDHRFTTRLLATGPLAGGVLRGDLILQGGGDPALATEGLLQLLGGLTAAGLQRVEGRFLYDTALLPELAEIDAGQPWAAPYNTGVGALSLNYNRALLSWRRGAAGPEVLTVADAGRLPLDSVAVRPMAGGGGFPLLPDGADRWLMMPPAAGEGGSAWVPVARPGLAAATLFRRLAADAGITLPAPQIGRAPAGAGDGAAALAALDSPPLTDLARGLLRHSNNLSAEVIGLAASRRLDPSAATLERSAALLQGWLTRQAVEGGRQAAGWSGLRLANHSGLGTGSRSTPRQMGALLRAGGPALWELLPGEEDGKALPAGVHAKTGTLAYVKGLAGLLTTAGGRRLGFVLFIADPRRRAAMDAALDRRVTATPPEARAWAIGAARLQAEILERWVSTY
ncbi:D-alanyl-D-alanine carboxypeptidase/D-alanyl-D-alanine-endopeptidase (penicillin-binding protein 4) [Azospirillum lipoferum]|uniref:D-alanyl-D-alanine carboxypeptidase/D-alanyl-D-alanine-endopeptidase n=1 Tax=Azospirillum TaxID=191 RepID=UPI001FE8EE3A|nr:MULTISPECIES: D-alanyl-D-alanine carboxypeptidase [Azospirillum]MCP1610658.1 D-alanyl-D-alanine carboxypeptidase/D-alanyl-D-alanine-endopeptidase (penicillin-binding protein 4) [Azospirillum lipoferum]MDW5537898.1 D-alanyl-D-alanine carboxypeptidase [Azospirillum sp. NL1]